MKTLIKRLELSDFKTVSPAPTQGAFKRIGYVLSGDNYSGGALDVTLSEIGWRWRKAGNSTAFATAAEVLSTYGGGVVHHAHRGRLTFLKEVA